MSRSTLAAFAVLFAMASAVCASAAEPIDNVSMTITRWREPGSNNIGTADMTLTNKNAFAVGSIRVKCHYVTKDERTIETTQTLPMILKPNSTRKFRKVRFAYIDTDSAEGACKIESVAQK
ncbi:hypothetical protein ACSVBT_05035 [Afipia sp. TerB]